MKKPNRNSLVSHLKEFLNRLSHDMKFSYCSLSDWERDFSRLSHELVHHGSRILTLDLPALGKHFDRCLDQGLYTASGLPLGSCLRGKVPVLLRDLYLQIFDIEGKLRESPSVEAIFCLRTLFGAAKKIRLPCSDRSIRDEIQNFIRIEQEIDHPTLNWYGDDLFSNGSDDDRLFADLSTPDLFNEVPVRPSPRQGDYGGWPKRPHLQDVRVLESTPGRPSRTTVQDSWLATCQKVFDLVASQLGDFSHEEPHELPKHGPGAVAEGGRMRNKYAFANWPLKLEKTFPYDYYGHPSLGCPSDVVEVCRPSGNEPPSRLIAVPKTQKGPRLIAAEPEAHQWIQQLVKTQLEERMQLTALRHSISFRDQTLSGDAVLRGSIDGSLASIDLSSASDRLSCWLVERAFRVNLTLLTRLHACRTRWLTFGSRQAREFIVLRKFAPMGSAVTFPVQSIIYAMVAIAADFIVSGEQPSSRSIEVASRRVRVFGDDIIVPREHAAVVAGLLTQLGLRVNADKSFWNGKFRESCGVDAWGGYVVTPPKLLCGPDEDSMAHVGSTVEIRNNFYRSGFWKTAEWLDSLYQDYWRFIPNIHVGQNGCGRVSFQRTQNDHLRKRMNVELQREEVRVLLPIRKRTSGLAAAHERLLQWFCEKPRPELRWSSGWTAHEVVDTRPGWIPAELLRESEAQVI